jgi:hypothetical protein
LWNNIYEEAGKGVSVGTICGRWQLLGSPEEKFVGGGYYLGLFCNYLWEEATTWVSFVIICRRRLLPGSLL